MIKYFVALLFCSQYIFSQNTDHLDTVLKQLKLKKTEINLDLFTQKVLPNDKSKRVMVVPKYTSEVSNDYFVLDAYILVIDNATGKIIYKFIEPDAWTSDAIILNNITIDTGLYILNNTTRAFGVRTSYHNTSRSNPYSEMNLSLYIVNNNSLKPVLKNYILQQSIGDWDTHCKGEFENETSTINIDKLQTKKFNNLIVKTKIVKTKNMFKNGDCDDKETTKVLSSKLIFNGKEYK
ncbi:hypothetical protein [Flavobacterium ginsengiterrae]|uniref:Uncharacterized protein n=1 Tax=Flavobacterium ginsengiterrae TaxID=871695 RepID=A0ABP7GR43_9FLAO